MGRIEKSKECFDKCPSWIWKAVGLSVFGAAVGGLYSSLKPKDAGYLAKDTSNRPYDDTTTIVTTVTTKKVFE